MVYPAYNNYQLSHEIANEAGHLILRDGTISHNWSQIASDRKIWGKSHNSQKNAKFKESKQWILTLIKHFPIFLMLVKVIYH